MTTQVFTLPDVGEGLTEAEILRWHVRPGDVVTVNQVIVEIETAKASVELPCPYSGTVETLHVEEGTVVPVGAPIISISGGAGEPEPSGAGETARPQARTGARRGPRDHRPDRRERDRDP
jgi:pyruvate dehydrogenase E2 component (dihydrolipoamide acetyltransferase)